MRTRVASSDWCASRNVVSVTPTYGDSRSHRANPAGPSSTSFCFEPGAGCASFGSFGSLRVASGVFGRSPCGLLTVWSAR